MNSAAILVCATIFEITCGISASADDVERSLLRLLPTFCLDSRISKCSKDVLRIFGNHPQVLDSIVAA